MSDHTPESNYLVTDNLSSLQTHVLSEESKHPGASGDFSWIISAISLAGKTIANKVRRARLDDVLGAIGSENVQGEMQQKLDVIANEILLKCLGGRESIAVLASEEDEEPLILRSGSDGGKYCVLFDPLDGSSNLDVAVGVGTIFTVLRNDPEIGSAERTVCQKGLQQVAAGYILYGSSTVLVLTTGHGVEMFVLDMAIGSFLHVESGLKIPPGNKTYSVNEAYAEQFPTGYRTYLQWAHEHGYSSRYIGSMVADVHRILMQGGVFIYPPTVKNPRGQVASALRSQPHGDDHRAGGGLVLQRRPEDPRSPAQRASSAGPGASREPRRGRERSQTDRGLRRLRKSRRRP